MPIFKLRKKKEEKEDSEKEEETVEENFEENIKSGEQQEDDFVIKINERLNEIENRIPKMDISISNLKKEIDSVKEDIKNVENSMKDMMVLYEVVSSQINPFVGSSKATKLNLERIDDIAKKMDRLEELIIEIQMDLRFLYRNTVNVKDIVNEILYGEVIGFEWS